MIYALLGWWVSFRSRVFGFFTFFRGLEGRLVFVFYFRYVVRFLLVSRGFSGVFFIVAFFEYRSSVGVSFF